MAKHKKLYHVSSEESGHIKSRMALKGYNQTRLAQQIGINSSHLSRILKGSSCSLPVARSLYASLDIPFTEEGTCDQDSYNQLKMEDISDKIGEAKAGIETARLNLLDAYLTKIRNVYTSVPSNKQDDFLNNLENIVGALEKNPSLSYDPAKEKK